PHSIHADLCRERPRTIRTVFAVLKQLIVKPPDTKSIPDNNDRAGQITAATPPYDTQDKVYPVCSHTRGTACGHAAGPTPLAHQRQSKAMTMLTAPAWQTSAWLNTDTPLELDQLRGKVILLHAFQMLCPGCVRTALPQAKRIARLFTGTPLVVVGLHSVFE